MKTIDNKIFPEISNRTSIEFIEEQLEKWFNLYNEAFLQEDENKCYWLVNEIIYYFRWILIYIEMQNNSDDNFAKISELLKSNILKDWVENTNRMKNPKWYLAWILIDIYKDYEKYKPSKNKINETKNSIFWRFREVIKGLEK